MSLLADAENSNSAFVSALQSSFPVAHSTANISSVNTATTFQVQLPPVAPTPAIAPSVSCAIAAASPATSVKMNSILKNGKWNVPMTSLDSIPDEGSVSESDPNHHTVNAVIASIQSSIYSTSITGQDGTADPRTELDSHANMVVLSKHSFIFELWQNLQCFTICKRAWRCFQCPNCWWSYRIRLSYVKRNLYFDR